MPRIWQQVTAPDAVKVFLSGRDLPVLAALMQTEWAVASLAASLHLPLNATHHRVRRLLRLGLVRETRLEARRGRPIRHYRASSEGYLVPYHATPLGSLEELVGVYEQEFTVRFLRAVVGAATPLVSDEREIGLRVFLDGGEVSFDVTPTAGAFQYADLLRPDRPALLLNWGTLHLDSADAKALQHELSELHARYAALHGPERYLLRLGLTPDVPGDEMGG
ncbi:hypothetical protein [Deinococcus marmoris]|uniref:hypothetical protein n=1 Tax=Deinococcus marmoris TaxID=249408 RepID=UPI00049773A5|nr:hypothetical protein [Deinococcus marmoris]